MRRLVAGALALAAALPAQAPLKSSFDRRVVPPVGPSPEIHIPGWTRLALSNGVPVIVAERHGLPLVSVQLNFIGGANQYEPAGKPGLAGFVGSMLTEGTTTRSGDQLSNDLQMVGTNIGTTIGAESGRMTFVSTP